MIRMEEGSSTLPLARGELARGGAAPGVRRDGASARAADLTHAAGRSLCSRATTTFRPASSTSCRRRRFTASGCRPPGRPRAPVARIQPRGDSPDLCGDAVRHGTLGEGIVTAVEPGGVVSVLRRRGHGPAAGARLRAAGADRLSIEIGRHGRRSSPSGAADHALLRASHPDNEFTARFAPNIPADRIHAAFEDGEVVEAAAPFRSRPIPGGLIRAAASPSWVLPTASARGSCGSSCVQIDDIHERGEPMAYLWASRTRSTGASATDRVVQRERGDRATVRRSDDFQLSGRVLPRDGRGRRVLLGDQRGAAEHPGMFVARRTGGIGDWPTRSGAARAVVDGAGAVGARRTAGGVCALPASLLGGARDLTGFTSVIEAIGDSTQGTGDLAVPARHRLDGPRSRASCCRSTTSCSCSSASRRLSFEYRDGLWVRLVDIEAALLRSYKPGEPVVIEVVDEFSPWNAGRWRVGVDGAERTDAEAELAMPVEVTRFRLSRRLQLRRACPRPAGSRSSRRGARPGRQALPRRPLPRGAPKSSGEFVSGCGS